MLGWALIHDTVGRPYTGDFDHAAARVVLERARKLGELLQYDARGGLHEGTDRTASLQVWRAAYGRDDSNVNAERVMRALLWADAGAELARFARARPEGATRNSLLIAGVALASGTAAALQEAATLAPESARKAAIGGAAGVLLFTGERTDAIDAYHRVKPDLQNGLPGSYDLAQRRLAVLGAP